VRRRTSPRNVLTDLVGAALSAKLAADLGDRSSARDHLADVAALLPIAELRVQDLAGQTDDDDRAVS